eukprot:5207489-Pleurochrysis_carterae.AAC.2
MAPRCPERGMGFILGSYLFERFLTISTVLGAACQLEAYRCLRELMLYRKRSRCFWGLAVALALPLSSASHV